MQLGVVIFALQSYLFSLASSKNAATVRNIVEVYQEADISYCNSG